ncbi:unnamed protein product [Prunus armeniaca]|uniref:Uncharacterized protein n=1 Tax=Prunus armeniaca TaxID=36596 RepID=A0A6J5UR03_PRUAR|nr:unnamed protein product [Prunus armeniaca]
MSFFPLIRAAKAEAAAVGSDGGSWSRRQQLGGHGVGFVDEEEEMSIWGSFAVSARLSGLLSNRLWACKGRTPASDGSAKELTRPLWIVRPFYAP